MIELDLNLLRVFDTLIELRSVTRSAERLGLTQSAVSHALGRLRRTIGDPLFLRSPNGLQPTARAEEIAPGVHEGLVRLRGALAAPSFDPALAERRFVIAAGAYFCVLLLPTLLERVRREAPGISVRIVPVTETLVALLDRGTIDLALGGSVETPARFVEEPLFEEEMVWIAAAANPIAATPVDAALLAIHPRVMIAVARPFESPQPAVGDQPYFSRQREWDAPSPPGEVISVYDSQTAVAVVARTDLVALVPKRTARPAQARGEIALLDTVQPAGSFALSMLWHGKQRSDAGLAWLRGLVRQCVG